MFQFQYGAIKSFSSDGIKAAFTLFQFQYGAIKSTIVSTLKVAKKLVSIPIWCD